MLLPSVERYAAVIEEKNPNNFSFLNHYNFSFVEKQGRREYCFSIGTCAAVFKACKDSEDYAIRCFLRGELETFKRYEQLHSFFSSKDFSWKVDFDFLDNEIQVNGQWYPIVKMDWLYGVPLNKFIDEIIFDHIKITELQEKLVALSKTLEEAGIGHGDLKYNNIIVQKQGLDFILKLIDYDSLFIPAFRGKKNLEPGSPGFQHPRRLSSFFTETIDRFSVWVMLTTLEAARVDAQLWKEAEQDEYTNSEHSLFTVLDFIDPAGSRLFQKLKTYNHDGLNYYLHKLMTACSVKDLAAIEKPGLYKSYASSLSSQQQTISAPLVPVPVPEEERYEVEIKTIPSGKDVLVHEIKKGITPLTLQLSKHDFDRVVVLNEGQRTPVLITERTSTYEIDFSQKPKEFTPPPPPPVERDEIIEFRADKYTVEEGELAILNWKVKGEGKIHITNMGDVDEKVGTKKITIKNTTDYVLTIGSENRSLTINVQSKPKPIPVQPVVVVEEKKYISPVYTFTKKPQPRARRMSHKILQAALILAVVMPLGFFAFKFISDKSKLASVYKEQSAGMAKSGAVVSGTPLFTQSSVTSFLRNLYASYNKRDLSSIMNNYASSVNTYYQSGSLTKDSLSRVIHNLFLTPVLYNCTPDFKTLRVQPLDQKCKVVITINERLKNDDTGSTDSYTTRIEYLLNPSYKIISEKSPG